MDDPPAGQLSGVCSHAAQKGMMVELEVFDYDMDKAALIGPVSLAARFAADMGMTHHNFGLMADLSHFPTTYETSRCVVRTLRPYITHSDSRRAPMTRSSWRNSSGC